MPHMMVAEVAAQAEEAVLAMMRSHPLGVDAKTIGDVTQDPQVCLRGTLGVTRQLTLPHAEPLPRIC